VLPLIAEQPFHFSHPVLVAPTLIGTETKELVHAMK
jgi:hypothetical protein